MAHYQPLRSTNSIRHWNSYRDNLQIYGNNNTRYFQYLIIIAIVAFIFVVVQIFEPFYSIGSTTSIPSSKLPSQIPHANIKYGSQIKRPATRTSNVGRIPLGSYVSVQRNTKPRSTIDISYSPLLSAAYTPTSTAVPLFASKPKNLTTTIQVKSNNTGNLRGALLLNQSRIVIQQMIANSKPTCYSARNFSEAAQLHSILPDPEPAPLLSRSSRLHKNIDIVRPPSLVFATNDSHTDHIVAIWDMFVRENTLTIIFARYMESYGCGLYEHVNITVTTVTESIFLTNSVYCITGQSGEDMDIIEESKYEPLTYRRVSVDAVRICRINILPSVDTRRIEVVQSITVSIDYLGFVKTFDNIIPIERAYPHSYGANATSSQLVVNTMLGDKPRHSMTTLITWLRYHHRLGVQQVFVYLMQPVQWLIPAEEVRELIEYISSLEAVGLRLTFVDWSALYYNTTSHLAFQHPRGCSHLAIIQSNLYRIRLPFYPSNGVKLDVLRKSIAQDVTKWMLECDVDDFLLSRLDNKKIENNEGMMKAQRNSLLSFSTTNLLIPRVVALEFHNRYSYLLPLNVSQRVLDTALQSKQSREARMKINASEAHKDEAILRKFIIPSNNLSLSYIDSGNIIVEMDLSLHRYRPKLIYNVEEVMLGGPHRIDLTRIGGHVQQDVGYYLHLLQDSIGRDIDMIERPGKVLLKDLSPRI